MEEEYLIVKPEDFLLIINKIITWYKHTNLETLVIALQGDLGAGKTTFTQILGQSFGVREPITSPTFTIMKQYELENEYFDRLVHIDAYRIEDETEVLPLRLIEVFKKPRSVICVEWPEQIASVMPSTAMLVKISISENDVRKVTIQLPSEK